MFCRLHECLIWLLLLLGPLSNALDEREYDAEVAPPLAFGPWQMWRSFAAQLSLRTRQTLTRWHLIPPQPRAQAKSQLRSTTTTEATLEFYGALNPIYQQDTF